MIKSEKVTLKQSKNSVSLIGYGSLLAAAKFLNDLEIISNDYLHLGFLLQDNTATGFIKLSSENYDQEMRTRNS
jgi:hypothetical protein